jgi:hypothetical protein
MATSQQDIDNSEQLLDLSNKILDSITQRKKLLQGINAEEQSFLNEVRKQQRLSQDIFGNSEKYLKYQVKSKDLAKQIKKTTDDQAKFETLHNKQRAGLINQAQNAQRNVVAIKTKEKDLTKEVQKLDIKNSDLELLKQNQLRQGNIGLAKQIQTIIKENQINAKLKEKEIDRLKTQYTKQNSILYSTSGILKNALGIKKVNDNELTLLKENLEVRKRIEKSTGALGALAKAATKLPGIGQYLNAPEAIEEMEQLASEMESADEKSTSFTNRLKIGLKGVNVLAKGFVENITSPEAIFSLIITSTLKANTQVVALGKALGSSSEAYRENLVDISRTTNNLNVSTTNLAEAFNEIVKATGFAYNFSADQLVTQIKLTKQVGLTADEAAQVQRYGALTGKTSEETYRSFLKGIVATRNQLKVGIDFKTTLAEVAKVSGQIAANLGFNPERIAQAVVTAKALGLTFDQLKSATSSLLDFGSSIENELKAELLTGKQLNLERARAAALAGDQVTLAEELSKNVGTAADFAKMNVLQQNALSASMGITSDQLSETLRKREEAVASGKSLQQINEEEAAQALERQSIQEKFNAAMLKLQDIVGNLIAGPFGILLNVLTDIFGLVTSILKPIGFFGEMINRLVGSAKGLGSVLKGILGVATLISAIINPLGTLGALAVGAAAIGTIGALTNNKFANGGRPPANQTSLVGEKGPELFVPDQSGTIISNDALNKNQNNISGPSIDLTPMIAAINEVRSAVNNLVNRPIYLSIDGKNIGTALVQGSHKVA